MKILAIMWVGILTLTPLACIGMVFAGVWVDWRWALTAAITGFVWVVAFAGTLAALNEDVSDKEDLDIPSWMSEN